MINRRQRNQHNRNSSASATPLNSRVDELGTGSSAISDPQPPNNGQTHSREIIHPQETSSASHTQAGTTNDTLPRPRIRWTTEMNECVIREYLKVTRNETVMVNYRQELYRSFVQIFPHLHYLTEQNIADRRRVIYRRNLISQVRIHDIASEILNENNTAQHETPPTQLLDDPAVVRTDVVIPEQLPSLPTDESSAVNDLTTSLNTEYWRALAEYQGVEPAARPRIKRQPLTRRLAMLLKTANECVLNSIAHTITGYNDLDLCVYSMAIAITKLNRGKIQPVNSQTTTQPVKNTPRWMKRLEDRIALLRKEIGILTAFKDGHRSKRIKNKVSKIKVKYVQHAQHNASNASIDDVLDTTKQRLGVYTLRMRRYRKSKKRKDDNRNFTTNQKAFYRKLQETTTAPGESYPEKNILKHFWADIWAKETKHNTTAVWLGQVEEKSNEITMMSESEITSEIFSDVIKKLQNWKSPGVNGIHNFWYKKLYSLHNITRCIVNEMLSDPNQFPLKICEGTTYLIPKTENASDPSKYRPITCLNTFYKILTACILSLVQKHCDSNRILEEEQKGCCKGSYGCKEQVIIDSILMSQAAFAKRNLYACFIDYRKAFDLVPHDWLIRILRIYKVNERLVTLLEFIMKGWNTNLILNTKKESIVIGKIAIKRGIFQGDTFSPYWFCLALNPLATLLNQTNKGFEVRHRPTGDIRKFTHLSYMDDIKLYASTPASLKQLVYITERFSNDIQMELGIEKCRMQALVRGKLTAQESYRTISDELIEAMNPDDMYAYLGFTQGKLINHTESKLKIQNEFINRLKLILGTSLNSRNLVIAINTFAIPTVTFTLGVLKWSQTDLMNLERLIRVQMTRFRYHHPKSSIERVDIPRKLGGRGIVSISNLHLRTLQNMRKYFRQRALTSPLHQLMLSADDNYTPLNLAHNEDVVTRSSLEDKIEQWKRKALHGRYPAELDDASVDKELSCKWLTIGYLYPETEGFMIAIQDQIIKTKNYRKFIMNDQSMISDSCRLCGLHSETIQHLIGGCSLLAPTEYKTRHDNVAKVIHKALALKHKLIADDRKPTYVYQPQNAIENDSFKLYWDRSILTDRSVQHDRPDITLYNKTQRKVWLIDIAVVITNNLQTTHRIKIQKYTDLARIVKEQWRVEYAEVVPIVLSATGIVPTTLRISLDKLELNHNIAIDLQKSIILNTCHTIRKIIDNNV